MTDADDVERLAQHLADEYYDEGWPELPERKREWYRSKAREILDLFAGRLVPPGSEVREEWGVRWASGHETWGYLNGKNAASFAAAYDDEADGVVLHRRVLTTPPTPWTPSEPEEKLS